MIDIKINISRFVKRKHNYSNIKWDSQIMLEMSDNILELFSSGMIQ